MIIGATISNCSYVTPINPLFDHIEISFASPYFMFITSAIAYNKTEIAEPANTILVVFILYFPDMPIENTNSAAKNAPSRLANNIVILLTLCENANKHAINTVDPAVIPNILGLASGFFVIPCIIDPATDNDTPTSRAPSTLGNLISFKTKVFSLLLLPVKNPITSLNGISFAPNDSAMIKSAACTINITNNTLINLFFKTIVHQRILWSVHIDNLV